MWNDNAGHSCRGDRHLMHHVTPPSGPTVCTGHEKCYMLDSLENETFSRSFFWGFSARLPLCNPLFCCNPDLLTSLFPSGVKLQQAQLDLGIFHSFSSTSWRTRTQAVERSLWERQWWDLLWKPSRLIALEHSRPVWIVSGSYLLLQFSDKGNLLQESHYWLSGNGHQHSLTIATSPFGILIWPF